MLGKYIIRNSSVQFKLLMSYFLLILIPIALLGVIFYNVALKSIEKEVSERSYKALNLIAGKLDMIVDYSIAMSNVYYFDDGVIDILNEDAETLKQNEVENSNIMQSKFKQYNSIFSWLNCYIAILGNNNVSFNSWGINGQNIENVITPGIIDTALKNNGRLIWISTHSNLADDPSHDYVFTSVRQIKSKYSNKDLGLLVISFSENILSDIYKNISDTDYKIYIVDKNSTVVSSLDKNLLGKSLNAPYLKQVISEEPKNFITKVNGQSTLVLSYPIKKTGWNIVQLTPVASLLEQMRYIGVIIVFVSFVCIVIAFILSYMIARKISNPLKSLARVMRKAEGGDLSVTSNVKSNDEIGELSKGFNSMITQIAKLMEDLVRGEEYKRKAELEALQAQINPHFLCNSLTSIRCMMAKDNLEVADDAIIALGKLIRQTFGNHEGLIDIRSELENLNNYILIQKMRYNDRFDVNFDIDDDILDNKILRMTLQPLVENSIFHGFESKTEKGTITITGCREGSIIKLQIIDDGVGMSEGLVKNILKDENNVRGQFFNGVGLKNIHERLIMNFGERFGLNIESSIGEGSIITMCFPAIGGETK